MVSPVPSKFSVPLNCGLLDEITVPAAISEDAVNVIVLSVPNGPGSLAPALRLVADAGVNVEYAYGGATEGAPMAAVVVGVEDALRAAAAAGV